MPTIKCPNCGHRHFQAVTACVNCGAPLSADWEVNTPVMFPAAPVKPPSSINDDIAAYERFLTEETQRESDEGPPSPVAQPAAQQQQAPNEQDGPSRQLVLRREASLPATRELWKKKSEIQPYEPYETALDVLSPDPFASANMGMVTIKEEMARESDPELWKHDRLPWYFPKTAPNISGTVILIESREEVVDYPDLVAAIATLLVQFIWIMTDTVQEKENDRVMMTTIRVQTYDSKTRDARLRGNMRGANLSLGDKVSLWGWRRHGVLFIRRGFNHTTEGVISTSATSILWPALLIVIGALICFYFIPGVFSWLVTSLGHLFAPLESFFHLSLPLLPAKKQ